MNEFEGGKIDMKRVWIASIFACILLLVPFSSVIGATDVEEDCNCNPVSNLQVVRIERWLTRLESKINFILLRYGHIPEVAKKCEGILELINSNDLNSVFCDILDGIITFLWNFLEFMPFGLWLILFYLPWSILAYFWVLFCLY